MSARLARRAAACAALASAVLVLGACGNKQDDTAASSTSSSAPTTAASATDASDPNATALFNKDIQAQLVTVGCYTGSVDGIIGPKTDAAIIAFQSDSKLEVDGELGPETEKALTEAATAKRMVCVAKPATPPTTKPSSGPTDTICTHAKLSEGVGGDPSTTFRSYRCAGGYAAVVLSSGQGFILAQQDQGWVDVTSIECNSGSSKVPMSLRQIGCAGNGNAGDPNVPANSITTTTMAGDAGFPAGDSLPGQ